MRLRGWVGACALVCAMAVCINGRDDLTGRLCDLLGQLPAASYAAHRATKLLGQIRFYRDHRADLLNLPRIHPGASLKEGVCGQRVPALRTHLIALGFLASDANGECIDDVASGALHDYQQSHDLEPDSVAGPLTLARMNVPVDARIAHLTRELETLSPHSAKSTTEMELLLGEMKEITESPSGHSFSEVARAHAISQRLNFRLSRQHSPRQCGIYHGRRLGTPPSGASRMDCTIQGVRVLNETYRAFGRYDEWRAMFAKAVRISNQRAVAAGVDGRGIRVTVLMEVLQQDDGWHGILWGPDSRRPWDGDREHVNAIAGALRTGTYYNVRIDPDEAVLDYRPTNPEVLERGLTRSKQVLDRRLECKEGYPDRWQDMSRPANTEALERIRKIPFGIVAARGGKHVSLILDGVVYEAHSRSPCTDPELVEVTDLSCWWWNSGVILVPPN